MTVEEAIELHLKWFGTAGTRKPPTDENLRRILRVTRETWEEAEGIVAEEREKRKNDVQVFICRRGRERG